MNAIQYEEHFHIGIQIAIIHLANVITGAFFSPHIFANTLHEEKIFQKQFQ